MDILDILKLGHFESWWTFWIKIKNFKSFDFIQNVHQASSYPNHHYMPEIIYSKAGKILEYINFKQDWKLDLSHEFILYCKGYFAVHGITFHIFQHTG